MFRNKKLSKYLIISGLLHIIIALAMSRIYADQPQKRNLLKIVSAVKIEYKKPEPPPKPKVVAEVKPVEKVIPKEEKPKVKPKKVDPPKVVEEKSRKNAPGPGFALGSVSAPSRSAPGVAGIKGARGPVGDLPNMAASGGVKHPSAVTKVGGSGLSPGITHGSMEMPAGTSELPGAGGKGVAGFRMGASQAGTGVGEVGISGSGGRGGRSDDGPGAGSSTVSSRTGVGGGQSTTGLGAGATEGMGEIESGSPTGQPGGDKAGPGSGGYEASESRGGPELRENASKK